MKKIAIALFFVLLLAGCTPTPILDTLSEAEPTPELSPREVVELQLVALRENDDEDRGIAVAFRFASPTNRRSTGPLERFARMIKGPLYRAMLSYDEATYAQTIVRGPIALQRVELTVGSERVIYDFLLVRQRGGSYDSCWMTEAVQIVDPADRSQDTLNV